MAARVTTPPLDHGVSGVELDGNYGGSYEKILVHVGRLDVGECGIGAIGVGCEGQRGE